MGDTRRHDRLRIQQLTRGIWRDLLVAGLVFVTCLAIYNATLTPSLSYESPDGNELATVCYTLGLAHTTGYPLYTWLGKLFTFLPVGDVAHRVNLMSAILGAGSVATLYGIVRLLTSRLRPRAASRLASAFAALSFGFSRTFWSQTGIAEVYAPNVFMVTLTLLLLLAWAQVEEPHRARPGGGAWWRRFVPSRRSLTLLAAFGLCFGLSLGTHMSNLGFAPGFALFILLVSWRTAVSPVGVAAAGGGFFLGLLQFLWLPLRASTLTDRMMRERAPTTLRGIYNYTLGAFPQFKFAFPLVAIPDRIVIYLDLLRQQFGLLGIGLGVLGMWALLWRRPRRFFLVVGAYLLHVWFFVQYRVFDLDVFFIPAHLLYAIFIGFGVAWLMDRLLSVVGERRLWRAALIAGLALVLALPLGRELRANWEANDTSHDTAVNDFYENVFELLPEGAVLLGRSGVFGYDMFYYRLVYDVRPDVVMPHLPDPDVDATRLDDREIYTTIRLDTPQAGRGPWALPAGLLDRDAWHVPVLFGGTEQGGSGPSGRPLVLYRVTDEPPRLVVPGRDADPQHHARQEAAGWVLLGYDLESGEVRAGEALHLTTYWRAAAAPQQVVLSTRLGEAALETHELGMGNLHRAAQELQPVRRGVVVEAYAVVVPRHAEPGSTSLSIGVALPFQAQGGEAEWEAVLDLGQITVLPQR
jgi:hypothetical protein